MKGLLLNYNFCLLIQRLLMVNNYLNNSEIYKNRTPPTKQLAGKAQPPLYQRGGVKIPSLFAKGGLGWVKKHYQLITAGLITTLREPKCQNYQKTKNF